MKKTSLLAPLLLSGLLSQAQMSIQSGAVLYIESGAKVTIQGDLTSAASIQGPGTILMKGSALQNINMNGNTIPNLEIDNAANVTLTGGSTKIGTNLLFTNGKLLTSSQDLFIASAATISNHNATRFIWTDGTGQVRKELTGPISNYEIPVGVNNSYRPVSLTTIGGVYASADVGVRSVSGASGNKPPMMANYISAYWPVTKTNITGGTQTISGTYVDPADIGLGSEANLSGYFFNGTDWTSVGEGHNTASNTVSAPISAASGELTGMNKFITVGSRAFLQGAYDNASGLMNDALRTGGNVIPVNDPYRSVPYSATFTHVSNPNTETASGTVFNNQASINDDIVDWVFLELRNTNASPGNTILQTRSALLQRDGDIVDIDGTSPVTFNNQTNGSFVLSVRHRNHLGLSSDNMSNVNWRSFTETKSTAFTSNLLDLRTAAAGTLYVGSGGGYTTSSHPGLGTINLLWAGDVSSNGIVRYQGSNGPFQPNDRIVLLQDLGSNEAAVLNTYQRGDLNMNKITRYQGSNGPTQPNDRLFLLQQVLSSSENTIRTQVLPN